MIHKIHLASSELKALSATLRRKISQGAGGEIISRMTSAVWFLPWKMPAANNGQGGRTDIYYCIYTFVCTRAPLWVPHTRRTQRARLHYTSARVSKWNEISLLFIARASKCQRTSAATCRLCWAALSRLTAVSKELLYGSERDQRWKGADWQTSWKALTTCSSNFRKSLSYPKKQMHRRIAIWIIKFFHRIKMYIFSINVEIFRYVQKIIWDQ
jgi:hypothetical protein